MKKEQLERLKTKLEELKSPEVELIKSAYYQDGCYCAIGYLVKDNADMLELLKEHNTRAIAIASLATVRDWLIDTYGIHRLNMYRIQSKNDIVDKQDVIEYIEELIAEEEGENESGTN